ncbi:MAG: bifunctional pyr operon transcriptional regulator/uracil phosphoribosyltransferase PyrR [Planctomycetes bacterium]|nr:bifunctional pyr operon transcriptional regulator/uracil phosphoribosyltransferase PyrR [Planctomycetota bacterium]
MKEILSAEQIEKALSDLVNRIALDIDPNTEVAVIGIRSRGEILAQRLVKKLSEKLKREIELGVLDITLYRDDINDPQGETQPTVRSTEIEFDISDKLIILVDDVLYTGRSTRSALDALMDLGRPKAIRLAVLVDRGHRELPIQADYVSCRVDIPEALKVSVHLTETDDVDRVTVK